MEITKAVSGLVKELSRKISYAELAKEMEIPEAELRRWEADKQQYSVHELWGLARVSQKYGFFDLLPAHGITPVSYNLAAPFELTAPPVGHEQEPPAVPLIKRETTIAGYPVDFPLGLPASVLAANAKWIEFYARRGFDILTYKTVRTRDWKEHRWPNWVFIRNPVEINDPLRPPPVTGYPGYWPRDLSTVSMANSFGVPSFAPNWWQEDLRRAREIVIEGHQVLIVSVIASVHGKTQIIAEDFVNAARMARDAGADIIEANYSCPNTPENPTVGELYQDPENSRYVSAAIKEALGDKTPFFVKIGYLPEHRLREFVEQNVPFIDGIVAINTISAQVVSEGGQETFPERPAAGISGWAIKASAHEVAKNLVALRNEIATKRGKRLTILGLGGVLGREDAFQYLDDIGVDGVESCTGAFLKPNLGIEIRLNTEVFNEPFLNLLFGKSAPVGKLSTREMILEYLRAL